MSICANGRDDRSLPILCIIYVQVWVLRGGWTAQLSPGGLLSTQCSLGFWGFESAADAVEFFRSTTSVSECWGSTLHLGWRGSLAVAEGWAKYTEVLEKAVLRSS